MISKPKRSSASESYRDGQYIQATATIVHKSPPLRIFISCILNPRCRQILRDTWKSCILESPGRQALREARTYPVRSYHRTTETLLALLHIMYLCSLRQADTARKTPQLMQVAASAIPKNLSLYFPHHVSRISKPGYYWRIEFERI